MQIIINDMGIPVWPIGILALIVVLAILWRRKHNLSYLFFFSIFWVYVMFSLDKIFFPIEINGEFVEVMKQIPLMSQVNLVPFYFGQHPLSTVGFIGIINNIVLTVPFGFGLNFISRVRMKDFLWLSITISLGTEVIQFVISLILKYPYRVVDINDALLNAMGVLIGYGLFKAFAWLYLTMTQWFKIEHGGLSSYVYNVTHQTQDIEHLAQ